MSDSDSDTPQNTWPDKLPDSGRIETKAVTVYATQFVDELIACLRQWRETWDIQGETRIHRMIAAAARTDQALAQLEIQ